MRICAEVCSLKIDVQTAKIFLKYEPEKMNVRLLLKFTDKPNITEPSNSSC